MNIKKFKERCEYWLFGALSNCCTSAEESDEIQQLINIISLIEENVIVKGKDIETHFVSDISLNAIVNNISCGYEIIKIKDL